MVRTRRAREAAGMASPWSRRFTWLPRGRALSEADFAWRHRFVCAVLALHVPVLLVLALTRGRGIGAAVLEVVPVVVLTAAALAPIGRTQRALAASLGLVVCSALLVHLYDGATAAHFHYFVVVAVIALYQDWTVYALAIGFVALEHVLISALSDSTVFDRDGSPWLFAVLPTAAVLAESAVLVIFWHASDQARAAADRLRAQLSDGQSRVQPRLDGTARVRPHLIAAVSHDFRTPLTGIRGAALTLLKRGDRLDEQSRQRLLAAVLDQQERLSRLLENMLTAARATAADPTAMAEVDGGADEDPVPGGGGRPECPAPLGC